MCGFSKTGLALLSFDVLLPQWQAQSFTYGNSGSPTGGEKACGTWTFNDDRPLTAGSMKHGVYGEDWHMTDVVVCIEGGCRDFC